MFNKTQQSPLDLSVEIRPLIHKLGMSVIEEGRGVILTFVAARSGEGTTTVARSFVRAFSAETGKKVLLIETGADAGFNGEGIVELASSGANIAQALMSGGDGVSIGKWVANAQGKASSGRVMQDKSFWRSLQDSFDAIVIDAPSLQESSEGIVFAQISSLVVLVVEAETTRKEVVENLRETLTAVNVKIAGIVMNKRKFYIPEKVYNRI